jgi:hypothetical protein
MLCNTTDRIFVFATNNDLVLWNPLEKRVCIVYCDRCSAFDRFAAAALFIYDSTSGLIQDSWVQDFNSHEHDAWFTSSASG